MVNDEFSDQISINEHADMLTQVANLQTEIDPNEECNYKIGLTNDIKVCPSN